MELWIPFTIAAAFFQNLRSAQQKHLKGKLSTLGASYVRFVYALPVALIYWLLVSNHFDRDLPDIESIFFIYATLRWHLSDHVYCFPALVI